MSESKDVTPLTADSYPAQGIWGHLRNGFGTLPQHMHNDRTGKESASTDLHILLASIAQTQSDSTRTYSELSKLFTKFETAPAVLQHLCEELKNFYHLLGACLTTLQQSGKLPQPDQLNVTLTATCEDCKILLDELHREIGKLAERGKIWQIKSQFQREKLGQLQVRLQWHNRTLTLALSILSMS